MSEEREMGKGVFVEGEVERGEGWCSIILRRVIIHWFLCRVVEKW